MSTNKKLSWIAALVATAALTGCDPYDDTAGGTPRILSVFASTGSGDGGEAAVEGTLEGDGSYTLDGVDAGPTVIFIKTNKLLDGASIQTTPTSCVPAAGIALQIGGAPAPADWYACYVPSSGTAAEGASVVIYQGEDIAPGVGGHGYFEAANLSAGTHAISGVIKDRGGNEVPFLVNATVVAAP